MFGETRRDQGWTNGGAFAEFVAAPADTLARKPGPLTFVQAAVPTSWLSALQGVHHQGEVESAQSVLINGAGGGVGIFAVQLATADGVTVTGVDSRRKLELIASIGADDVFDYATEDFTRRTERYDLVLDIAGNHSFRAYRRALAPGDGTSSSATTSTAGSGDGSSEAFRDSCCCWPRRRS